MRRPAAARVAQLVEDVAPQRVALRRRRRRELLVQAQGPRVLREDQGVKMDGSSAVVGLGRLPPLAILEL